MDMLQPSRALVVGAPALFAIATAPPRASHSTRQETFAVTAAGLNRVGETATAGARIGLFVPDLDRLFTAVPQQGASIMVPVPLLP